MNDIYDKLAKRADEGKVEIHPVPVVIAIVAESQDEAQDFASELGGSAQRHPNGDHFVRVSDRAAAELGAHLTHRMENESQIRLLNDLHGMWKASNQADKDQLS